jgi:hypothetical protein
MGGMRAGASFGAALCVFGCALLAAVSCSGAERSSDEKAGCKGGECESRYIPGPPDAGVPLVTENDSGAPRLTEAEGACVRQSIEATPGERRPVDIVFVVDNSGSMSEEIAAIRRNIDHEFASIIDESDVDYRVIMLSQFGEDGTGVCIDPPLAGADCSQGIEKTNGERYFHFNQVIGSNDALCQILDTIDNTRADPRAPNGFSEWLRPDAAKAFVLITDDSARCSYIDNEMTVYIGGDGADPFEDALTFHAALRAKAPEQFAGHYQFFSIIGIAVHGDQPQPVFPTEPLDPMTCNTAPTPGLSYQALSIATDGLRYPVCEGRSFDAVFQVLAQSVIQTAKAECTFELPEVQAPQVLDLPSVNLEVRRTPDAEPQNFDQVSRRSDCQDAHSFFIQDRIELCPQACQWLQRAPEPAVEILYACSINPG